LIVTDALLVSGVAVLVPVPAVPAVVVNDAVFGTVNTPQVVYCRVLL